MASTESITHDHDDVHQRFTSEGTIPVMQQRHHDPETPSRSLHTDTGAVHDESTANNNETDSCRSHVMNSAEMNDGPRRTMRKVSRRVLPLAAAAYGISAV